MNKDVSVKILSAYVGVVGSITYNEGYICYIGSNADADDGSSLMCVFADGSGAREDVYSKKYNTDKWTVHRGYFHNAYREYRLEDKLENINKRYSEPNYTENRILVKD